MRFSNLFALSFTLISLFILSLTFSNTAIAGKDDSSLKSLGWKNLESIDIYSDDVGDFLKINPVEYLKKAADSYESGDYETSAKCYIVLAKSFRNEPVHIYNLACCYGLLGEENKAAFFLKHAFMGGFYDIEFIKSDPDFDNVRGTKIFDETMKELESKKMHKKLEQKFLKQKEEQTKKKDEYSKSKDEYEKKK